MIRLSFLVLTFVAVFVSSFAQYIPPVLKETSYRRGIYRTFTEFLNNAPSIVDDFSVEGSGERFRLVFKDSAVSRRHTKMFWGFSTGDSVFVNTGNYQNNKVYRAMREVNRYCYWEDRVTQVQVVYGSPVPIVRTTNEGVVLNMNNGNFYFLNKQVMYSVLKTDAKLLSQYKNAPNKGKNEVMFAFLSKYNAAHRNEIGRIEKDAGVVLFRRDKKERPDSVTIVTSDSVVYSVGPGQSIRFNFTELNLTLCVGNTCKDIALSNSVTNYIQCTYREEDLQPGLQRVEDREGEFYLREIEAGQQRTKRKTGASSADK